MKFATGPAAIIAARWPEIFIIEGMVAEFRNDRFCALIQHFDITAQRDQGDNIFGAEVISSPPERLTKPDPETLNANTTTPGNPEMTKFMHGDKYTQCNDERSQIPEKTQHITFR